MFEMIVDCISDLHGYYPELEGGDLLIVAGDLTAGDEFTHYWDFICWLYEQNYKSKIVVAGNHDNFFCKNDLDFKSFIYLCDSGTEFEGFKIWGSPWTKTFEGMNPHYKAFTVDTEDELAEKWALIPNDIDILITHSPPHGIWDRTADGQNAGSTSLHAVGSMRVRPIVSVFGHIHEAYGYTPIKHLFNGITYHFVNASHVNECYQPVNKPIRVIL
jgi:Icc-related predicted phosphoesterase